ncbi:hypothetical protein GW17_00049081 [Ensete ventricosum]|nr:hypothetical protein GW17_00049081 [Ensete ventricosum]
MISLQFGYAGMNIITKVSLTNGMSHYVLVVYRHAFATLSILPFALFLERYASVVLISCYAMILESVLTAACSLLPQEGAAYDDEVGVLADIWVGTSRVSSRSLCTQYSYLPNELVVLVMWDSNVRMEKVDLRKLIYQAKVAGTLVTVAGAMLMTLYKGPLVEMVSTKHVHPHASNSPAATESSSRDWFLGSIFLILATLAWASLFVLQVAKSAADMNIPSFKRIDCLIAATLAGSNTETVLCSAVSHDMDMLHGDIASHSRHFRHGAQAFCLDHRL